MADVTSRISTLPGSEHSVPEGMTCDEHPDRPAVRRVQGETDSFGCEMTDMCQQCYDEYIAAKQAIGGSFYLGSCGRCKSGTQQPLFPYRDWEEGSCGPVYYYCRSCRDELRKLDYEALDRMREDDVLYGSGDDFFDDDSGMDDDYEE